MATIYVSYYGELGGGRARQGSGEGREAATRSDQPRIRRREIRILSTIIGVCVLRFVFFLCRMNRACRDNRDQQRKNVISLEKCDHQRKGREEHATASDHKKSVCKSNHSKRVAFTIEPSLPSNTAPTTRQDEKQTKTKNEKLFPCPHKNYSKPAEFIEPATQAKK